MKTLISRASVALLERVSALAQSQFRNEAHVVAVPAHSSPLGDGHLALLNDQELDDLVDAGEVKRLLELSKLVDCVQDGTSLFRGPEQSPGFVSERFREIVRNVVFQSTAAAPELRERYAQALAVLYVDPPFVKTAAYERFGTLRSDLEQKDLLRVELLRRASTVSNELERSMLTEEIEALEILIAESRDVLDALDRQHAFTAAEETKDLVEAAVTEIPESVTKALDVFDLHQITDPDTNESHVRCNFMPDGLSDDNWIPVKVTSQDIAETTGELELPPGSFATALATLDDQTIASVELEVQILAVQRPWFWGGLFDHRGWTWRRTPAEPVSEGVPGGRGLIPAYVTGIIIAQNLVVRSSSGGDVEAAVRPRTTAVAAAPLARISSSRRRRGGEPRRRLSLRGTVADEHGKPVPGATAILKLERNRVARGPRPNVRDHRGERQATGRDGRFTFQVDAGATCLLTIVKPGFTTERRRLVAARPVNVAVRLRPEPSTWPVLTVRVRPRFDGAVFDSPSEVRVSDVAGARQHAERLTGAGEVGVRLPPGRYRIEVESPDARQVTPAARVLDLSANQTVEVVVDTGVLLRRPDLQLFGFICKRVSRSPQWEEQAESP
jgi:hypothetical protein